MHRRLPSPAMLVALLALFVALGAGAYAASKAPKNSVTSKSIKNGQVKHDDLAADSVDTANIKGDAVKGPQIAPGAVGSAQIGDGAVSVADLDASATPDKDLDLLRGQVVRIDDPADGTIETAATLLTYGPFTITAHCQDNGSTAELSFFLTSTEHGWVNTSSISPDDFNAGEIQPLAGQQTLSANNSTSSGGYAVTDSGRFMQTGIIGISKPGGATDCAFHTSGWGG